MTLELIEEVAQWALITAAVYFIFAAYTQQTRPSWKEPLEKRRWALLAALAFAVGAVQVAAEVLGGESRPIDKSILLFIHSHAPRSFQGFFHAVTMSGSWATIVPLAAAVTMAFLLSRHRFEALLIVSSVVSAAVIVYVVKSLVGRERPVLWVTDLYWGSSFPSGHTLVVTAMSTALVLCLRRIWPAVHALPLFTAVTWILLVALSRLVLGVHWPTDVLAAVCLGAFLPLAISVVFELIATKAPVLQTPLRKMDGKQSPN